MTAAPGTEVTVRVPATSANLGPGFDSLGLALALYDDVRVRVEPDSAPPVTLHVEGEGAASVPLDGSHLVVRALHAALDALDLPRRPLTMWCTNRVPHARGLGSSAAATVAGVLAGRALAGSEPDEEAALALATAIEGHPDNAAAALMGGLTIAWTDGGGAHAARMEPSPEIGVVVLVPEAELSTATARGVLPAAVPHADAAHSAGRAALLVEALTRRPDLLLAATEDRLHQDYRAVAMPATAALVTRLRAAGVAAAVSGAGPSVLVLAAGEPAGLDVPDGWTSHRLAVDRSGAQARVAAG